MIDIDRAAMPSGVSEVNQWAPSREMMTDSCDRRYSSAFCEKTWPEQLCLPIEMVMVTFSLMG
ncbi:hypothetical protein OOJ09_28775 [Mesorhizobium qingshengii]|uniref:Uncharacterized protein n=1 Tax=Mesorhizobium qingshengii TaxID=1165689 RepID=A0ABT4R2X5_9HYPH|nr:hypothetical protein [Mesorhizobium qingshengii]MCZ8548187.1 hypothetical protein [Mesorhizobium qingshengii]